MGHKRPPPVPEDSIWERRATLRGGLPDFRGELDATMALIAQRGMPLGWTPERDTEIVAVVQRAIRALWQVRAAIRKTVPVARTREDREELAADFGLHP